MSQYVILQEFVYDALCHGAVSEGDVKEYLKEYHPRFYYSEDMLFQILENHYKEF